MKIGIPGILKMRFVSNKMYPRSQLYSISCKGQMFDMFSQIKMFGQKMHPTNLLIIYRKLTLGCSYKIKLVYMESSTFCKLEYKIGKHMKWSCLVTPHPFFIRTWKASASKIWKIKNIEVFRSFL